MYLVIYAINNEVQVHKQAQPGRYISRQHAPLGEKLWNMWLYG